MSRNSVIRNLTVAALFSALISVGAFIRFNLIVPFTMQMFFIISAALMQKARYSIASVAVYIATGLLGLPIFSGGGGFNYIFKPSFGFVIGFLPAVAITSIVVSRLKKMTFTRLFLCALLCMGTVYAVGLPYSYMMAYFYTGGKAAAASVFSVSMAVLIPLDVLKSILAAYIAKRLQNFSRYEM